MRHQGILELVDSTVPKSVTRKWLEVNDLYQVASILA